MRKMPPPLLAARCRARSQPRAAKQTMLVSFGGAGPL